MIVAVKCIEDKTYEVTRSTGEKKSVGIEYNYDDVPKKSIESRSNPLKNKKQKRLTYEIMMSMVC